MPNISFIEKYTVIQKLGQHLHEYWEIIYIIEGRGHFNFKNIGSINYKKNDILIIPPDCLHENFPSGNLVNINLTISNWNPNFNKPQLITHENKSDIYSVLEMTYKYYHMLNHDPETIIILTNLITKLVENNVSCNNISLISRNIEAEISNSFSDPLFNLQEIYKKYPYNPEYIRKTFIKDFRISPHGYLIQLRIDAALRFLEMNSRNNYSIKEISLMCGFSDPLFFSRTFKKIVKKSPREYLAYVNNKS